MSEKPALHVSHMNMMFMCGEKFRRIYLNGEFVPSGKDLIIGSAVHKPAEKNLIAKVETGSLLTVDNVKDIARDAFETEWKAREVYLDEEDRAKGIDKTKGEAIDITVSLAELHAKEVAPSINPAKSVDTKRPHGVERKFRINTGDRFSHDIAGQIDVEEDKGIRDLKTSGANKAQSMADNLIQLSCYSLAFKILNDRMPEYANIDMLVKTKTPKYAYGQSVRTQAHLEAFLERFKACCDSIDKGIFIPADSGHWCCSPEWCGFARLGTCKYHCNAKAISMAK